MGILYLRLSGIPDCMKQMTCFKFKDLKWCVSTVSEMGEKLFIVYMKPDNSKNNKNKIAQ